MRLLLCFILLNILFIAEVCAQAPKKRLANQALSPTYKERHGVLDKSRQIAYAKIMHEAKKITFPETEQSNSTFRYLQLADSYSRMGDSISASKYFVQINPYHNITILAQTGLSADSFYSRFTLTQQAVKEYHKLFSDVYTRPRTAAYDSFRNFYSRTLSLKAHLNTVEAKLKKDAERVLLMTDSIQSAYLRAYVQNNGWPSLADGSIFAAHIARRDLEHYYIYLPYLKDAFLKNEVPLYLISGLVFDAHYFYSYMMVKKSLAYPHKCYDVTAYKEMFADKFLASQSLSAEIFSDMKKNCEILDYYFVYYANDPSKAAMRWMSLDISADMHRHECFKLYDRVTEVCPLLPKVEGTYGGHIYLPNNIYKEDKEFFCVIYKE